MPGLTIWLTSQRDAPDLAARFADAQTEMLHAPDYTATVRVASSGCLVGHVNYPEYPIRFFDVGPVLIGLEGRIYNKRPEVVDRELSEIARQVFGASADPAPLVRRWMQDADGEYVVILADPRESEVLVFSDFLGRLPVYYFADDSGLLLAREAKFVQRLKPRPAYDRLGWAEILWVGYPLGRRTVFQDVVRGPSGLLLRARIEAHRVACQEAALWTCNVQEKDDAPASVDSCASDLADRFTTVCRDWGTQPDVSRTVLSLSGGQDSRAVAAGMVRAGVPVAAMTFLDAAGDAAADARLAERLAACLGLDWQLVRLPAPDEASREAIIRMKDGMNHVGMAFILGFLREIRARWGPRAAYLTGDGGDKVLPYPHDYGRFDDVPAIVRSLARRHSQMPTAQAEALLGLAPGALFAEVGALLATYPETDGRQKTVHFLLYERGRKWLYEGEDRSRFFLWASTPFYSNRFFGPAMRVPDALKSQGRLYARFQSILSPKGAAVADALHGAPPGSLRFRAAAWAGGWLRLLPGPGKELAKRILGLSGGRFVPEAATLAAIRAALRGPLAGVMDPPAVERFLGSCGEYQFLNFWTLVLLAHLRDGASYPPARQAERGP